MDEIRKEVEKNYDIIRVVIEKNVCGLTQKICTTKDIDSVFDYLNDMKNTRGVDFIMDEKGLPRIVNHGYVSLKFCWIFVSKRKDI